MPRFINYENNIFDVDSIVYIQYAQVELAWMRYAIYFKGIPNPLILKYRMDKTIPKELETMILYTTQNKFYPENR